MNFGICSYNLLISRVSGIGGSGPMGTLPMRELGLGVPVLAQEIGNPRKTVTFYWVYSQTM